VAEDCYADIVERLFCEFELLFALPEILAVVQTCRHDLGWEPAGALPELVERLARQRLTGANSARGMQPTSG
jgi:hypothetical protein